MEESKEQVEEQNPKFIISSRAIAERATFNTDHPDKLILKIPLTQWHKVNSKEKET